MKRSALLLIITTIVFVRFGYTQDEKGVRYAQLRPIEILQLASTDGASKIIAVDNTGKLVYQDVQRLTAETNTTSGANLVLSKAVNTGGGTVWIQGTGATSVTYDDGNKKIIINSTDSYGPSYSAGNGISISGGVITASDISAANELQNLSLGTKSGTVQPINISSGNGVSIDVADNDNLPTNEAQTLTGDGTTSPTINLSKVSGAGGGTITFTATAPIVLSHASNTINISSTGAVPNLQQVTNVGNITDDAIVINGMTVHGDVNVTGGSYPTGDNIRIGKSTTGVAPIGQRNIALGTESMITLMLAGNAIDNVGIGFNTLNKMTSGNSNIAIGSYALQTSETADFNMAIGEGAFKNLDDPLSDNNIAIGFYAGSEKVNPKYTTVIGTRAFELGTGGDGNTAVGHYAIYKTVGNDNTAVGADALVENTSGSNNTAIGRSAMFKSVSGIESTGVGIWALRNATLGQRNTGLGAFALMHNQTGINNVAIGAYAGHVVEIPGPGQGDLVSNVNNSVYIGYDTRTSNALGSADNEIVIGAGGRGHGSKTINLNSQKYPELYIGNTKSTDRVFYEPLYCNEIVTPKAVLRIDKDPCTKPIWEKIVLKSTDGTVVITEDVTKLEWNFSVPCCKSLLGEGDISVSENSSSWIISYTDPDKDPTNEIEKLKIDPATGALTLVGADGTPIPVVGADGKEVLGNDGKPLTSIIFSGLTFDPATKTFKLPCPCDPNLVPKIEKAEEFTATEGQKDFNLSQIPAATSVVKMYINGVRISNTAYTTTGKKLTYIPEANGAHGLLAGERIQFDYSY